MKKSARATRMKRHHARKTKTSATLNMISLMDIFTILVFFLLVNATSEEVLPSPKNIILPDSIAEKIPAKNLVIAVNEDSITLQGNHIISVSQAMNNKSKTIKPLYDALRKNAVVVKDLVDNKGVTIMGDKKIPYALLKKIMLTCAGAEYTNLSFAVNQKAVSGES